MASCPPAFDLLSRLWLAEPASTSLREAQDLPALRPHCDAPAELAQAFADLFLLNVYPYASVFLEPTGELNGARAREMEAAYRLRGYAPSALLEVAAPDHIGLMLDFLEDVGQDGILPYTPYLLDWAPVLCLAVEREPGAHPFYRALASLTREALFESASPPPSSPLLPGYPASLLPLVTLHDDAEEEITLRAIVRHLLAPARSGVFLSRARLGLWARELGTPAPFGERFAVAVSLFEAAGASGQVGRLLDTLSGEIQAWDEAYAAWAVGWPGWAPFARDWRDRTAATQRLLDDLRQSLAATTAGAS